MREEYIADGGSVYWNHDGVMELVFREDEPDGTHIYVTAEGKKAAVRNEDELCPISSRIYKHFEDEYRRNHRNRR